MIGIQNQPPEEEAANKLLNHAVFQYMRDGVAVYRFRSDGTRHLLDCNSSLARMAGRRKEDLLSLDNLTEIQDRESTSVEDTHIQQCFNSGTPYINNFSWIRPDGQDNVIESQSFPVTTEQGILLYTIDHDITEQKHFEQFMRQMRESLERRVKSRTLELVKAHEQSERVACKLTETVSELELANRHLKTAQSQIVMQEKLASVGQLASGISHELNSPIGFLAGNFEALTKNVEIFTHLMDEYREILSKVKKSEAFDDEISALEEKEQGLHLDFIRGDIMQLFDESREGFKRISTIINSMREFSHIDTQEHILPYDINHEITTTLVIARHAYKNYAWVQTDLGDLPEVRCIPGQINQVLLNLIINSSQAIASMHRASDDPGLIQIKTWYDETNAYCEIRDNGPGIAEDNLSKIFDPFFT
ncbi:hypothetical protein BVY04_00680, partial [bacterium M21]